MCLFCCIIFMNQLGFVYWLRLSNNKKHHINTILLKTDNGREGVKHCEPIKQRLYHLDIQCAIVYDIVLSFS